MKLPFRTGFLTRLLLVGFFVALAAQPLMGGLGKLNIHDPAATFRDDPPALTQEAMAHILHGDARGGGHFYGTGKPCKSEFPADWDEIRIRQRVSAIAANDNLPWQDQQNGYRVAEATEGSLRIRVVVDPARNAVVTAYPVNVRRNPCPAANDNHAPVD